MKKKIKIYKKLKTSIKSNDKKYNFGFAILKALLALDVIRNHCFNPKSTKNKIILLYFARRRIHVPSFFILSFYFMHKELILLNFKLLGKRLQRLLIPYICWPIIIYFLNNNILHVYFRSIIKIPRKELKTQLLWAYDFVGQLWFQWVLIVSTIIFFIVLFIFRKYGLFVLQLLLIFEYFLQYSGYNVKFYNSVSREKRECLGRFTEVFPSTVTGFTLAYFKIIDYIHNIKIKTFTLSLLVFNLVKKYNVFMVIKGQLYQGIIVNVRAVCLVFIFSLFPSEKIRNPKIINCLKHLTNYTAGIYYLHLNLLRYLKLFVKSIDQGTFEGCLLIYFICYSISFISMKFVGKTFLRHLFS